METYYARSSIDPVRGDDSVLFGTFSLSISLVLVLTSPFKIKYVFHYMGFFQISKFLTRKIIPFTIPQGSLIMFIVTILKIRREKQEHKLASESSEEEQVDDEQQAAEVEVTCSGSSLSAVCDLDEEGSQVEEQTNKSKATFSTSVELSFPVSCLSMPEAVKEVEDSQAVRDDTQTNTGGQNLSKEEPDGDAAACAMPDEQQIQGTGGTGIFLEKK